MNEYPRRGCLPVRNGMTCSLSSDIDSRRKGSRSSADWRDSRDGTSRSNTGTNVSPVARHTDACTNTFPAPVAGRRFRGAVGMPLCLGRWSLAPEHSSMQEGSGSRDHGRRRHSSCTRSLPQQSLLVVFVHRTGRERQTRRQEQPGDDNEHRQRMNPRPRRVPTPEPATPPASSASAITAIPDPPPSSTRKPCSAKYLTRLRRKHVGLGVPLSGSVGPAGCRQPTRRAMPRVRSRLSRLSAILLHRGANANW